VGTANTKPAPQHNYSVEKEQQKTRDDITGHHALNKNYASLLR
jgi:hypothetical protein